MGLSPRSFDALVTDVQSPVLLVGGGTGSNCKLLIERGHSVVAVDSCNEMVAAARSERGVEIIHNDGESLPFNDKKFRSVIVATGVVNATTVYTPQLWRLFSEIRRVLSPEGRLTAAFFAQSPSLDYVFEHLRLDETPSRNKYFIGCKNIEEARARFLVDSDFDRELVSYIFEAFTSLLEEHLAHINRVARRLVQIGVEPSNFIARYLSFPYRDMSNEDSGYFGDRLRRLLSSDELKVSSFEDTRSYSASCTNSLE
jgi:SAM-dependent methyltransferase